jgi:hypothetical protein
MALEQKHAGTLNQAISKQMTQKFGTQITKNQKRYPEGQRNKNLGLPQVFLDIQNH